jgi:HAD superfamily hydrolase (TIGR01459 family)
LGLLCFGPELRFTDPYQIRARGNTMAFQTPPPIIEHAGEILAGYEVILCDVWGVLHDGRKAYDGAGAALSEFRRRGGTVVLVSNAPVPGAGVENVLKSTGVRRDCWDAIVSSGDIALGHIAERGFKRLHRVGPAGRDSLLFTALPGPHTALAEADAIVCSGLADDIRETVADYRPLIDMGLTHRLPFVCANPDLVVDVGGVRHLCAGSIAEVYEREGGEVFWAGKPHPSAYGSAIKRAADLRGGDTPLSRVLGIGDAVRTDLASAAGLGVDAIFVTSGIHNEETMIDGRVDPELLARLFANSRFGARAATALLRW